MRLFPFFLLLALCSCRNGGETSPMRPVPRESLVFAFYNVENMWEPANDPASPGDDEFTPEGPMKWTQERLDRKMAGVARALRAMNDGAGPDVIGLCETENRRVLEMLAADHLPAGVYRVVHAESPDERGIDVALLYRASAMEFKGLTMHRVKLPEGDRPTRDILEATFEKAGHRFTVLVNHWPSRRGGEDESAPRRRSAAALAARIVDSLTALDPKADVVLMGDLNDEPTDESIADVLDAREFDGGQTFGHRMINTGAPVARVDTIGTYYYQRDWDTFDQIMLASKGALDSAGLVLYETAETVFAPEFLRDAKFDPVARPPFRTYVRGTQYIGGVSDHFPVMLRVGWSTAQR